MFAGPDFKFWHSVFRDRFLKKSWKIFKIPSNLMIFSKKKIKFSFFFYRKYFRLRFRTRCSRSNARSRRVPDPTMAGSSFPVPKTKTSTYTICPRARISRCNICNVTNAPSSPSLAICKIRSLLLRIPWVEEAYLHQISWFSTNFC